VPSAQPLAGLRPFTPKGRHVCTSSARMSAMGDNSKELSPRRKCSMIASPAKASGHTRVDDDAERRRSPRPPHLSRRQARSASCRCDWSAASRTPGSQPVARPALFAIAFMTRCSLRLPRRIGHRLLSRRETVFPAKSPLALNPRHASSLPCDGHQFESPQLQEVRAATARRMLLCFLANRVRRSVHSYGFLTLSWPNPYGALTAIRAS
jgi:hypothetical protein